MGHRVVTDDFLSRVHRLMECDAKQLDKVTLRNNCLYYINTEQSVKADILKLVNMVEDKEKRKALRCVIDNML